MKQLKSDGQVWKEGAKEGTVLKYTDKFCLYSWIVPECGISWKVCNSQKVEQTKQFQLLPIMELGAMVRSWQVQTWDSIDSS